MRSSFVVILFAMVPVMLATGCKGSRKSSEGNPPAIFSDYIVVRNLPASGALEIENTGPDADLAPVLIVQRQEKDGMWTDDLTDLSLIEDCQKAPPTACIHLPHNSKLRPVPWTGSSCDSQCFRPCRANNYLGPGTFRFVASECNGKLKAYGPAFKLPPYPLKSNR